ncbi:MAG TPA: SEC-C metal-binding domain-containing protein [Planctomycetaceae bacterium]|nr:SEC-C metal-binding domain-containing protein [Planctomycetaceae bacterium]
MHLSSKLVKRVPKDVLDEGGQKLGILRRGMLVLDNEDQMTVLMDYCLHDIRRNGRNAIEQFLIDSPPDPDSDEMTCLRAKQQATYSLFVVESIERGVGVMMQELRSEESRFVVDLGFAGSAQPGLAMAARLLPHDGFWMSSGASLPVGVTTLKQRDALVDEILALGTTDAAGHFDPGPIIRVLMMAGRSNNIRYQDVPGTGSRQARSFAAPQRAAATSSGKIGRNEPCPCGSGKKFKHCCLRLT